MSVKHALSRGLELGRSLLFVNLKPGARVAARLRVGGASVPAPQPRVFLPSRYRYYRSSLRVWPPGCWPPSASGAPEDPPETEPCSWPSGSVWGSWSSWRRTGGALLPVRRSRRCSGEEVPELHEADPLGVQTA
ncbi:Protein GFS12 [Dissostichus eleginoides]|uniref:Protein GFS12 n=1 Tax=Dissostichus eleginoides TaxID=100907 RepID=A0AAD9CEK7_DISEL|nr:Protein GFS12 [Dissostichus eleginoides]